MTYRCEHCGKVVERDSTQERVESYCFATRRPVMLERVEQ